MVLLVVAFLVVPCLLCMLQLYFVAGTKGELFQSKFKDVFKSLASLGIACKQMGKYGQRFWAVLVHSIVLFYLGVGWRAAMRRVP